MLSGTGSRVETCRHVGEPAAHHPVEIGLRARLDRPRERREVLRCQARRLARRLAARPALRR